jgi:hypothetical protein
MILNLAAAARVIPITALMLAACLGEKAYEAQTQQLQQTQARAAVEQGQIAKMHGGRGASGRSA